MREEVGGDERAVMMASRENGWMMARAQ